MLPRQNPYSRSEWKVLYTLSYSGFQAHHTHSHLLTAHLALFFYSQRRAGVWCVRVPRPEPVQRVQEHQLLHAGTPAQTLEGGTQGAVQGRRELHRQELSIVGRDGDRERARVYRRRYVIAGHCARAQACSSRAFVRESFRRYIKFRSDCPFTVFRDSFLYGFYMVL